MTRSHWRLRAGAVLTVVASAAAASACGGDALGAGLPGRPIRVVAAENVWGSIAAQLGGGRVSVTSVVTDPDADPHEHQSTTADARLFADADYVILNGAGYDDWGRRLLSADATGPRSTLVIADLLGRKQGDNPHFWYSPAYVSAVVERMSADYRRIDPAGAAAFASEHDAFLVLLQPYRAAVAGIAQRYAGRPVAATEDIFSYLAVALHLDLVSPPEFMQAIAEGNEPPLASVVRFQHQLRDRQASVLVYNTQTVTAVTTAIESLAHSAGIPVVGISESLQPPGATFEQWQVHQLTALAKALGNAGG